MKKSIWLSLLLLVGIIIGIIIDQSNSRDLEIAEEFKSLNYDSIKFIVAEDLNNAAHYKLNEDEQENVIKAIKTIRLNKKSDSLDSYPLPNYNFIIHTEESEIYSIFIYEKEYETSLVGGDITRGYETKDNPLFQIANELSFD